MNIVNHQRCWYIYRPTAGMFRIKVTSKPVNGGQCMAEFDKVQNLGTRNYLFLHFHQMEQNITTENIIPMRLIADR